MNTCVFDDGEDMFAGTNQLRDLHGSSRRGFSVSLGPRAVLMQLESGGSWRGGLVRRVKIEDREGRWSLSARGAGVGPGLLQHHEGGTANLPEGGRPRRARGGG